MFKDNDDKEIKTNGFSYKMCLIKNRKYSELFIRTEEDMLTLKKTLKSLCVNSDFYVDYTVIKKVGSGAFASVSFNFSRFLYL
jgi:hypothetical protein